MQTRRQKVKESNKQTDRHLNVHLDFDTNVHMNVPMNFISVDFDIYLYVDVRKEEEKLRDVLQEREGTSLNYFKEFFNYVY